MLGFVSSLCIAILVYNKLSEQDMNIMLEQNELMIIQQQIIEDIEMHCNNRNWLSFGDEIYVCMHVNDMFQKLSNPPLPHFTIPDENEA